MRALPRYHPEKPVRRGGEDRGTRACDQSYNSQAIPRKGDPVFMLLRITCTFDELRPTGADSSNGASR